MVSVDFSTEYLMTIHLTFGKVCELSASKINFMYSLLHKSTITLPLRADSDENEYSCFEKG